VIARAITDERTHESTLFKTGSWLRGRLFLFDLGFSKYRRFALIDENDGFFVSSLKRSANPLIVMSFSYEPNLPDTWYQEARQPPPSRRTLLEEVNAALYAGFTS
jgi:hypothetical protein